MNVEIGAEAAQFPEKEYVNGIAFAVQAAFRKSFQDTVVGGFLMCRHFQGQKNHFMVSREGY